MRHHFLSVVLCLAVIVLGVVIALIGSAVRSRASGAVPAGELTLEVPPPVKIQAIESATLYDRVDLTGGIFPWHEVTLSTEVAGNLELRDVEEGDRVETGQVLVRVNTESLQAMQAEAQARLKLAEQELERIERLTERGVSTDRDLDRARAERDVYTAANRSTEVQLRKSVLTAPINGVVDRVYAEEDEFVDVGRPLVRLVQIDLVRAIFGIPERDIPHFKEGDQVAVTLDALPEETFEGTLVRMATTADLDTRTFAAEVEIANADRKLMPGMIARGAFVRRTIPDSILVPIFSVISLDDRRLVFVEEEGKAQPRPVEIGIIQGASVQIVSGLAPGDRLIVSGQRGVRPGQAVDTQELVP